MTTLICAATRLINPVAARTLASASQAASVAAQFSTVIRYSETSIFASLSVKSLRPNTCNKWMASEISE